MKKIKYLILVSLVLALSLFPLTKNLTSAFAEDVVSTLPSSITLISSTSNTNLVSTDMITFRIYVGDACELLSGKLYFYKLSLGALNYTLATTEYEMVNNYVEFEYNFGGSISSREFGDFYVFAELTDTANVTKRTNVLTVTLNEPVSTLMSTIISVLRDNTFIGIGSYHCSAVVKYSNNNFTLNNDNLTFIWYLVDPLGENPDQILSYDNEFDYSPAKAGNYLIKLKILLNDSTDYISDNYTFTAVNNQAFTISIVVGSVFLLATITLIVSIIIKIKSEKIW